MKKEYVGLRRRPLLMPLWLAGILAVIVAGISIRLWATADSTVVVVIRQAERAAGGDAAGLDAAGAARALLLARMLGDRTAPGRLNAILVTGASRGLLTAGPLAERLGLIPVVAATETPAALAHRVLRAYGGGRVLIIGDRDSVPQIVQALSGGDQIPAIDASDFGTMYIATVPRIGHPNLLRLAY